MEDIPSCKLLEFRPNTLEQVRRDIGLEGPGRAAAAVDILEDWVMKQNHFLKKDFSREYLERLLVTSKGLIERAKQKLEKLCTFKTLMPEFFTVTDVKKDIAQQLDNKLRFGFLPKLTKQHNRVIIYRLLTNDFDTTDIWAFIYESIMVAEYIKQHDYCSGFILIADLRGINLLNYVTKLNPLIFAKLVSLLIEGYGMRLKKYYILSESKAVETLNTFFKYILSPKILSRIEITKDVEKLYEYVPREILPEEYGGKEKLLKDISDDLLQVLSSPENMAYYKEMCQAATNESYREKGKFNDQYMGVPGAFRVLSID